MKTLVILAGGKSSRMGQDKVLLEFHGKTFIERIFFNALECFERVIISTDNEEHAAAIRSLPAFAGTDLEIVTDLYDSRGPIGGIRSVFESTDVSRFSIISVDVPCADMRVLAALYDRCMKKAVYLKMGEGRPEPLIAAYDRAAYENIRSAGERGLNKLRMLFDDEERDIVTESELINAVQELKELDFAKAFRNYNTPEEYKEILQEE